MLGILIWSTDNTAKNGKKIYPSKPPFIVSKRRKKYLQRRNPHYAWKLLLQLNSTVNFIVLKVSYENKKVLLLLLLLLHINFT